MWTEVSSSGPHFPQVSPMMYKRLLKLLCPVSRPITTPDCVLIKDNNWTLVGRLGPEINPRTYLCVLQGQRHSTRCGFSIQHFTFHLTFCLETHKKGASQTHRWTEPALASLSAIALPRTPAWPGTKYSPTLCRVEISFNFFWHCRNKGDDVLTAGSTFRAVWLSEQMLTYFSGLSWVQFYDQRLISHTPQPERL
jgi:hypothetical protein